MSRWRGLLLARGIAGLSLASARFPGAARRIARWVGASVWLLNPSLRRRVRRNLVAMAGGSPVAGRRVSEAIGLYYAELLSLPGYDLEELRDVVEVAPPASLGHLLDPGPTIILSAHWGAPEFCLQALLAHGRPFLAMVEALRPPELATAMRRLRESQGGVFVDGDMAGLRLALGTLRQGGLVALVGDRDLHGNGIGVSLCGRRVRVARGPWELARRTGARVVPVFTSRLRGNRYRAHIHEPIEVHHGSTAAAAQVWATLLEGYLRMEPEQWLVLEDFWNVHACREG